MIQGEFLVELDWILKNLIETWSQPVLQNYKF
jgi:hypothetical protein